MMALLLFAATGTSAQPFGFALDRDSTRMNYDRKLGNAAVSTVAGEAFATHPSVNLTNAVGGLVSGIQATQWGAEPTDDYTSMRIRGFRTLSDRVSDPLVIVDDFYSDYAFLDPNEIESVQVLKDAAATAIYGQRGANGVILIRTKRGYDGRFSIRFNAQAGVQQLMGLPTFLDSYGYARLYNEARYNDGATEPFYDYNDLMAYRNQSGDNVYTHPNVDFIDQFLKRVAPTQRYSLSMSGGNKYARYFVLLGYQNQDGFYKYAVDDPKYSTNANFVRYNMRANVDVNITRRLLASFNVAGQIYRNKAPYAGNATIWNTLMTTPPNLYPVYVPSGGLGGTSTNFNNPIGMMSRSGYREVLNRNLQAAVKLNYDFGGAAKGLKAFLSYAYSGYNVYGYQKKQQYAVYEVRKVDGELQETMFGEDKNLQEGTTMTDDMNYTSTLWGGLNYDRRFGVHGVSVSWISELAYYFVPVVLPFVNINHSLIANYDYNDLFDVGGSLTYSGSDSYRKSCRWGLFYSLSGSLNVRKLAGLESSRTLDALKVRLSYGLTGNNMQPSGQRRYLYQTEYVAAEGYNLGTGIAWNRGTVEEAIANPDVTWEKARQFNVGVDVELFHSLYATFDAYRERRDDILVDSRNIVPDILGQTPPLLNNGSVEAWGGELVLGYRRAFGDLRMNVEWLGSFARSRIVENGELSTLYDNEKGIGKAPYAQWGMQAEGLFRDEADVASSKEQQFGAYGPGDIKFADMNGDGVVNDRDVTVIGYNAIPEFYSGLNLRLEYKGFDLTANLVGAFNRSVWIPSVFGDNVASGGKFGKEALYRWACYTDPYTGEQIDTRDVARYPKVSLLNSTNNSQANSLYCVDGDYIRLRSVELGYSLPARLIRKIGLEKARIFINAYNAALLYNATDFEFPEYPGAVTSYGQSRIFTLGLSLTL